MLTPTSLQCFSDGESSDHDGRLLSLLDMPRFYAMAFTTAYLQLEMLQGDSILLADDESAWRQKAEAVYDRWKKNVERRDLAGYRIDALGSFYRSKLRQS